MKHPYLDDCGSDWLVILLACMGFVAWFSFGLLAILQTWR